MRRARGGVMSAAEDALLGRSQSLLGSYFANDPETLAMQLDDGPEESDPLDAIAAEMAEGTITDLLPPRRR